MSLPGYFIKSFFLFCTDEYNSKHQQFLSATHPYANEPKSSVDAAGYVSKHLTLQGKTPQSIKKPISNANSGKTSEVKKHSQYPLMTNQMFKPVSYTVPCTQHTDPSIKYRTFLLLRTVRRSKLQQTALTEKSHELHT